MFTYIDPKVRQRLLNQGKLITINPDGHLINFESQGQLELNSISILGPIPLPLILGDEEYKVDWYACCLLYTSPSPRDGLLSRMPSSA